MQSGCGDNADPDHPDVRGDRIPLLQNLQLGRAVTLLHSARGLPFPTDNLPGIYLHIRSREAITMFSIDRAGGYLVHFQLFAVPIWGG